MLDVSLRCARPMFAARTIDQHKFSILAAVLPPDGG